MAIGGVNVLGTFQNIGGALSKASKDVGKGLVNARKTVFGDQKKPDLSPHQGGKTDAQIVGAGGSPNGGYGVHAQNRKNLAAALQARQGQGAPTMQAAQLGPAQNGVATTGQAQSMNAAQIATGPQNQTRANQLALMQALQDQMAGKGTSAAQAQLQAGTDQSISNAMALAATQRGNTAGQGLRQVSDQAAMASQQAANQAAMLRAQETQAAQQSLGGVLSGMRGQDLQLATDQAGLNQQAGLANMQGANQMTLANMDATNTMGLANMDANNSFAIQNAGFNQQANQQNLMSALEAQRQQDNMSQFYQGAITNSQQADRAAEIELQKARMAENVGLANPQTALYGQNMELLKELIGAGGTAGAVAMMPATAASDENLKTDIKSGDKSMEKLLAALGNHEYQYKDKKWGEGRFLSPMAQEFEQSDIGKGMVIDTPAGKMVNYARAGGVALSAASMLNKKIQKLEEALAATRKAS